MTDLYQKIILLCESKGISGYRLCKDLKMQPSVLTDLKMGRQSGVSARNMDKIASYFGVSVGYLLGTDQPKKSTARTKGVSVPVLGRVAAGIPIEAVQDTLDYEEITTDMAEGGDYFGLCIQGDSMEPRMKDGDVVIVLKQSSIETGDVAVVLVNGCDATVKKIKKRPEGVMLIPSNPAYEPMFYTNQEIKELPVSIIGKVVELRAKF